MKKFIAFSSAVVLSLTLVSCADNTDSKITVGTSADLPLIDPFTYEQTDTAPSDDTEIIDTDAEISDTVNPDDGIVSDIPFLNVEIGNAKIRINDKDITDVCYANVHKDAKNAEIAITSLFKELGATVITDGNVVTITYGNKEIVFDTLLADFGLPRAPDSSHHVRKLVNGEIVIDRVSTNSFIREAGYSVKINYDSAIIDIISL